jgi:AsmA protein
LLNAAMRRAILVGLASVAVLLMVVGAASLFVDVDRFRPQLEDMMTSALGRKVAMGHVALSVASSSLSVEDLSVADEASFGRAPFLKARKVSFGVAVLPLIFSKHLRVHSCQLRQPDLTLRRSPAGIWNFSTLGASSSAATSAGAGPAGSLNLSIDDLAMTDGRVIVERLGAHSETHIYDHVTVEVRDFSSTTRFPFRSSATGPGGSALTLEGTAGPLSAEGIGSTPLEARLDVKRLDLAAIALVDPAAGIAGIGDATLHVVSDGRRVASTGTFHGNRLRFVAGGSAAAAPIDVTYEADYDLAAHSGAVKQGDVRIGKAVARLTGRFSTKGEALAVQMKLAGRQMPVADLEAILPSIGVTLPRGARFRSGALDADLTIGGSLDRFAVAGPVEMSNAVLAGFDLGSRLRAVATLAGLPGAADTVIQTLGSALRISPGGIRAETVNAIVPGIGSLTGEGTIAPDGRMDFRMLAKLNRTNAIAERLMRVGSLGHPENGIPFHVEGTTAAPVFTPDIARAAAGAVTSPGTASAVGGLMRKLFGKKKRS